MAVAVSWPALETAEGNYPMSDVTVETGWLVCEWMGLAVAAAVQVVGVAV